MPRPSSRTVIIVEIGADSFSFIETKTAVDPARRAFCNNSVHIPASSFLNKRSAFCKMPLCTLATIFDGFLGGNSLVNEFCKKANRFFIFGRESLLLCLKSANVRWAASSRESRQSRQKRWFCACGSLKSAVPTGDSRLRLRQILARSH